jgi:hypothetical protein
MGKVVRASSTDPSTIRNGMCVACVEEINLTPKAAAEVQKMVAERSARAKRPARDLPVGDESLLMAKA